MGSSQSKPAEPQTKVYLPSTPTEFSNGLIAKLDSSVESDYTRSQYTEKHIQDQVNTQLRKIEQDAAEELKKAFENLPQGKESDKDSNSLKQKLDELKKKLESRPAPPKLDKSVESARQELVKCFKDNKEKPLNCWDQVEAFKQQVQKY